MPSVDVKTQYHSTWLDNTKAKLLLGWRPRVDLVRLIEDAWTFQRAEADPRKVWYLG
jgi:nucleoside-diphosphate-sugar epimerase